MQILLVDDHPLILSALKALIEGLRDDVTVSCADSAAAARALLRESEFQLALLDLQLGDAHGLDLLGEFRTSHPALPVVVISASDRSSDVIRAIDQGAMGFLPKRSSIEVLSQALRLVMSGGIYVPALSLNPDGGPPPDEPADQRPAPAPVPAHLPAHTATGLPVPSFTGLALTPRQGDVLALLLQGMPNKLIARELGLSVETVKDHVAGVLKVLGVSTRTQAVLVVSELAQRGALSFSGRR
jgi:DNA-binding NarL/FixJ family response regulator